MIADIIGINNVSEGSPDIQKTEDTLGRDQFLKMFLAQLKYQDPLNPMEGTEFSAQLAQFSSLEQLFNINENLESLRTLQSDTSRFQALDLIGKRVEAEGGLLSLETGESSQGSFILDDTAECSVRIYDQDGYPVRDIQMDTLTPGQHSFEWDGFDENGEIVDPGIYLFEITAVTENGETLPVETRISGIVNRVNLDNQVPLLYIGEIPITLSQVLDIQLPESDLGGDTQ